MMILWGGNVRPLSNLAGRVNGKAKKKLDAREYVVGEGSDTGTDDPF